MSTTKSFRFDNGFVASDGLSFVLERNGSGQPNPDASPVASGVARYSGKPMSVAGAPDFATADAANNTYQIMGSGRWSDNTTEAMMVYKTSSQVIEIHLNNYNVANSNTAGRKKTLTQSSTPGTTGYQSANLFKEWSAANSGVDPFGGTAGRWIYKPLAGLICYGMAFCVCSANYDTNGSNSLEERKTVLGYFNDTTKMWTPVDQNSPPELQNGRPRGAAWQIQNWWTLEDKNPPLNVYIAFTDYRNQNGADGGAVWLMKMSRATPTSAWVFGQLVLLCSLTGGTSQQHWHTCAVRRYGTAGMEVVVSIGDGKGIQRTMSFVREDENYTDGYANSTTALVSSVSGSTGAGNNNWTTVDRHGLVRPVAGGGTHARSDGTRQFVGCAPFRDAYGLLTGADETAGAIESLTLNHDTNQTDYNFVYGRTQSRDQGITCFGIFTRQDSPNGGPYVAKVSPSSVTAAENGSSSWANDNAVARIVYSLDGVNWAVAASPYGYASDPCCVFDGKIFYGNQNQASLGLRYTPLPPIKSGCPLLVGNESGITNYLASQVSGPNGAVLTLDAAAVAVTGSANNTVQRISNDTAHLPTGVPPAPITGGYVHRFKTSVTDNASLGRGCGVFNLVPTLGKIPAANKSIRIKFWACIVPKASGGKATRCAINFNLGDIAQSVFAGPSFTAPGLTQAGTWVPFSFEVNCNGITISNPWQLGAYVYIDGANTYNSLESDPTGSECDVLIAWDSVLAGSDGASVYPAPLGKPFSGNGDDEIGRVLGLGLTQDTWSIALVGQIPRDQWDSRMRGLNTALIPVTLYQDPSRYVQLLLEASMTASSCKVSFYEKSTDTKQSITTDYTNGAQSFLREDPVFITFCYDKGAGSLNCAGSVGGVSIHHDSQSVNFDISGLTDFKPNQIIFGDASGANPRPMAWHGGSIMDGTDYSGGENTLLSTLSALPNSDEIIVLTAPQHVRPVLKSRSS